MVRLPRRATRGRRDAERRAVERRVYRPVLARVLLAVFTAFGGWGVADLVAQGDQAAGVLAGLWLTAAVAALGCLFWRPAVIVDAEAVELRNVVRDVRVPWSCLDDVTTRYTLTLHAGGRRHQSWAGSAPGRPLVAGRLPDERWNPGGVNPSTSSRDLQADSGATAFMVEQGWRAWRERHPGGRAGSGDAGSGDAAPGEVEPGRPAEVEVRWRPALPGFAAGSALVAMVLTPVLT